jgi:hypothetical protein
MQLNFRGKYPPPPPTLIYHISKRPHNGVKGPQSGANVSRCVEKSSEHNGTPFACKLQNVMKAFTAERCEMRIQHDAKKNNCVYHKLRGF